MPLRTGSLNPALSGAVWGADGNAFLQTDKFSEYHYCTVRWLS